MPHLNYVYKVKKEDRNDFQAQFMIPQDLWLEFKNACKNAGTTPSKELRNKIRETLHLEVVVK